MTKARKHMIQSFLLLTAGKKNAAKVQLQKANRELEIQYSGITPIKPIPTAPRPVTPRPKPLKMAQKNC